MKPVRRLILLALLAAFAFWSWDFFFPTPQKVIQKRLLKLARLASFSSSDGNIKRLADMERLGSLMTERIHVVLDAPGVRGETFDNREELLQAVLAARSQVKDLQTQFTDIGITVNPDRQSAVAFLTVTAKVGGEPDPVIEPLKFTFQHTNDDWLITGLESVKTLR
ncbi:MAG: hypothetical protein ABSG04_00975 [Verrucomicrobiota bacterium]|jgi:hypothetical protein